VEYKHGPKQKHLNDDLQLAGQALCLEEMLGRDIPKGAIFHATSRRRREVAISVELRRQVAETADAIRSMVADGRLPPPVNDRRCDQCSLKPTCDPAVMARNQRRQIALDSLFEVDPDDR
jgi:CRISPR-associated exonuclease Cas4